MPVASMSFDKDGKSFLYYDRKGSENIWRKHHTSSVARDIVYYNAKKKTHTILTTNVGEDRDPRYLPGYKDVVFLSERNNGSFNVYKAPANNLEQVEQVSHFKTHPVRFLSVSNDDLLCYGYMGEIYTQRIGSEPQKVRIEIVNDQEPEQLVKQDFKGAGNFALSSDGKLIAFVSRDEDLAARDEGNQFAVAAQRETARALEILLHQLFLVLVVDNLNVHLFRLIANALRVDFAHIAVAQ